MCSSGDSRRAEADATDGDALSGFHSWGAEAALSLFARESSGTACGEERCAGSFWTNGVGGDASGMVASVLQPLASLIQTTAVESLSKTDCHSFVSGLETVQPSPQPKQIARCTLSLHR